jgi:hypothetical protein
MLYIATLAEMKHELGISDSQDDMALTRAMEGLQGRLDGFLNRGLASASQTEQIFDGDVLSLFVRSFPIESVSEIIVDQDQDWLATDVLDSED